MAALMFAGLIWRDGRRDGKIDTLLEEIIRLSRDHETRIRAIEQPEERHYPAHRRR
jgi:hypothetical protein